MGSLGSTECYIPIDSTAAQILECQYLCRIPHRALEMAHRVTSVRMGPVWWFWLRQVASEMRMPVIRLGE